MIHRHFHRKVRFLGRNGQESRPKCVRTRLRLIFVSRYRLGLYGKPKHWFVSMQEYSQYFDEKFRVRHIPLLKSHLQQNAHGVNPDLSKTSFRRKDCPDVPQLRRHHRRMALRLSPLRRRRQIRPQNHRNRLAIRPAAGSGRTRGSGRAVAVAYASENGRQAETAVSAESHQARPPGRHAQSLVRNTSEPKVTSDGRFGLRRRRNDHAMPSNCDLIRRLRSDARLFRPRIQG